MNNTNPNKVNIDSQVRDNLFLDVLTPKLAPTVPNAPYLSFKSATGRKPPKVNEM